MSTVDTRNKCFINRLGYSPAVTVTSVLIVLLIIVCCFYNIFISSFYFSERSVLNDACVALTTDVGKKVVNTFSYSWKKRKALTSAQSELNLPIHKLVTEFLTSWRVPCQDDAKGVGTGKSHRTSPGSRSEDKAPSTQLTRYSGVGSDH